MRVQLQTCLIFFMFDHESALSILKLLTFLGYGLQGVPLESWLVSLSELYSRIQLVECCFTRMMGTAELLNILMCTCQGEC